MFLAQYYLHRTYKHGAIAASAALLKHTSRTDEEPKKENASWYLCCSYCNIYWDVQTCKWVCGFSENAAGSDLCSSEMQDTEEKKANNMEQAGCAHPVMQGASLSMRMQKEEHKEPA